MRLKISARHSHLARLQAFEVGRALAARHPELEIVYAFRESLGDKNLTDPLWKMPEKGVFTEDFYEDLITEETDLVVHSWKDLPTQRRDATFIAATLPRADQRDLLLFKKSSRARLANERSAMIFSSSPRRIYNLENFLLSALPSQSTGQSTGQPKKIFFESVRGNILTRLEKLMADPKVDGLIVAKAAIDRLISFQLDEFKDMQRRMREILDACDFMVLPLSENPNAAAQGAIAIEIKKNRPEIKKYTDSINDEATFAAVQQEREVLSSYGGGCHQKIGIAVLPKAFGTVKFLKGLTDQNEVLNQQTLTPFNPRNNLSKKKFTVSDHKNLFERTEIDYHIPSDIDALLISRISAYRPFAGYIWAAGLDTWKKLAAQNVWVSGCSDSLGDDELPCIQALAGRPLKWAKLTHQSAAPSEMTSIACYRLNPPIELPQKARTAENFFWMSAYHFDVFVQKFPEIVHRTHCCGPGNTFRTLMKRLAPFGNRPQVYLNEKEWRAHE